MADLTITAANVGINGPNETMRLEIIQFGATMTAGTPVYLNTTDDKVYKADSNVDAPTANVRGIVLVGAATGGYGVIVRLGDFIPGSALTVGKYYFLSNNVGMICPEGDVASTNFVTQLFYAKTTTVAALCITPTGIQHG